MGQIHIPVCLTRCCNVLCNASKFLFPERRFYSHFLTIEQLFQKKKKYVCRANRSRSELF